MSLPENTSSSVWLPGAFRSPDDEVADPLFDLELGGIALNDPSRGLMFQTWQCSANELGDVHVKPQDEPGDGTLLFSALGITNLSFAFDRNMRVTVVYVVNGDAFLRWFDTTVNNYVTTAMPGITSPRVSHDDKRYVANNRSDVILAYISNGNLAYRQQRDRYEVEYILRDDLLPGATLKNVGMSRNFRLQFELG